MLMQNDTGQDNLRAAEEKHLIYNHRSYFSGQENINSGFTQVYLF